jgi:hypothetical protein
MCGADEQKGTLFNYLSPDGLMPRGRPLRAIRLLANTAGETAEAMIQAAARGRRATPGADKAYDAAEHVARLRAVDVTPHVAYHTSGRRSAIDGRTTCRLHARR